MALAARLVEDPLLSIRNLSIAFGGVQAVENLSLDVPAAEVVSLIGPNGAGKTTVLNGISGFVRGRGSIRFKGVELLRRKPAYRRASLGIGRTFQNLQLFGSMTVLENVLMGEHTRLGGHILLDLARFPVLARERRGRDEALDIIARLGLEAYAQRRVEGLPFGVQKLVGVARVLALQPQLILFDEPAAGLTREEAEGLGKLILGLRDEMGVGVLLVEHNMRMVMSLSDHIVVLDYGKKLTEGRPEDVRRDEKVIEAYLGAAVDATAVEEVQEQLAEGP